MEQLTDGSINESLGGSMVESMGETMDVWMKYREQI